MPFRVTLPRLSAW